MDLRRYKEAAESFDKIIKINLEMRHKSSIEEEAKIQAMLIPLNLTRSTGYEEKAMALK
jgi:hypothetical protein